MHVSKASRKNARYLPGEPLERFCDRLIPFPENTCVVSAGVRHAEPLQGAYEIIGNGIRSAIGVGSISAFARKAGISPSAMHQYLSGGSEPTRDALVAIADATDSGIEWLATGRGPAGNPTHPAPARKVAENPDPQLKVSLLGKALKAVEEVDAQSGHALSCGRKARLTIALYEMFQHLPAGTPIPASAVPALVNLIGEGGEE